MNFGFVRIAAATPVVQVADCQHNVSHIATLARQAASQGAAIVAFPELSITGYTCGDLFTQPFLLQQAEAALTQLLEETAPLPLLCIAGLPVALDNRLYNTAVVFSRGQILGAVPKKLPAQLQRIL